MHKLKLILLLLIALGFFSCCSKSEDKNDHNNSDPIPSEIDFYRGADLSFLPFLEENNTKFYDIQGQEVEALKLMKSRGMNVVRIRLWHTPVTQASSFEEVKQLSKRVKAEGLELWLTVHYSDWWADPGNQEKPALWENLSLTSLKDSVYHYTQKIVTEIQPDIIQIGNETNNGFLWPTGKLSENPANYIALVEQGISAVRANDTDCKIMLHHAGYDGSDWYFNQLQNLDFDIIGLSYYPWWHGKDLEELKQQITSIKSKYSKEVVLAETAYAFTLGWNDWTNNIVGTDEHLILPDYPALEEGQKAFFTDLKSTLKEAEGMGYCYWAPEWIAWDGSESKKGSSWENLCLFNFSNKETAAMEAFFTE